MYPKDLPIKDIDMSNMVSIESIHKIDQFDCCWLSLIPTSDLLYFVTSTLLIEESIIDK